MKFKYIGSEPSEVFGLQWLHGVVHEVEDEHAIRKLSNNPFFMPAVDGVSAPAETQKTADVVPMKKARKVKNGDDPNAG